VAINDTMDLSPASRDPMRPPAPMVLVIASIIVALLLNLLPWQGAALLARPDFVLIILLYWAVHESRTVGQGAGFVLGLVMDVADSALLGQHAFVYVAAIFLVQLIRVRLLQLTVIEQALHVCAILFAAQAAIVVLSLSMGREFPGFAMAIAPLLGAVLWPIAHWIIAHPRFRRRSGGMLG
jgi:rod shape-determining protein MreD